MPIRNYQARLIAASNASEGGLSLTGGNEGNSGPNVEGTWIGVFKNVPGRSGYSYSGDYDEFLGQIQDRWDQDFDLVDVEFVDIQNSGGIWFGVFQEEVAGINNAYSTSGNFDTFLGQIQDRWDQGFDLVDVEYGEGRWFGVFQEGVDRDAYSSSGNLDTFTGQIQDRWDQGLELVDVEYGEGRWFGIFGENYERSAYSFAPDFDTFSQQVKDNNDQGLQLVDVESGDGVWFGVYQADPSYLNNFLSRNDLFEFTTQLIEQGNSLGAGFVDIAVGFEV